jgi:hypothetical protein
MTLTRITGKLHVYDVIVISRIEPTVYGNTHCSKTRPDTRRNRVACSQFAFLLAFYFIVEIIGNTCDGFPKTTVVVPDDDVTTVAFECRASDFVVPFCLTRTLIGVVPCSSRTQDTTSVFYTTKIGQYFFIVRVCS